MEQLSVTLFESKSQSVWLSLFRIIEVLSPYPLCKTILQSKSYDDNTIKIINMKVHLYW